MSFILIGLIFLYAFCRFPSSLEAGIAFEREKRAEARQDYKAAIEHYESAVYTVPALSRLFVAYCRDNRIPDAVDLYQRKLLGKSAPQDIYDDVSTARKDLEEKLEKWEQQKKKPGRRQRKEDGHGDSRCAHHDRHVSRGHSPRACAPVLLQANPAVRNRLRAGLRADVAGRSYLATLIPKGLVVLLA